LATASKPLPEIIEASSQKSSSKIPPQLVPKVEIENINKIEKKSHRIKKMALYPQAMPTKNKDGRNIKQHFGTWKYFLKGKLKRDEEPQKQKFYITLDCRKMPEM